jgi:hypothetical protein
VLAAAPAFAAEPEACGKFAWDVSADRQALAAAGGTVVSSVESLPTLQGAALTLRLRPPNEVAFSRQPERAPKNAAARAGIMHTEVPAAGLYRISLSTGAWLDVIQDGRFIKPQAFSGVKGCDGLRKSLRFQLVAGPLTLQVSDAEGEEIAIVVGREP